MKEQRAPVPVSLSSTPPSEIGRGAPWALSSCRQAARRRLVAAFPRPVMLESKWQGHSDLIKRLGTVPRSTVATFRTAASFPSVSGYTQPAESSAAERHAVLAAKSSATPQIPQLIHLSRDRLPGSITLKQGCCNQSMPWYRKGGKSEITRSPCRYQLSAGSRSAESHRFARPHATCRSWPKSARRSSRGPLPPAKSSGRQPPGPPWS